MLNKIEWIEFNRKAEKISNKYKIKIIQYLTNQIFDLIGTEFSGQENTKEYISLGKILGKMILDKIYL